MGVNLIAYTPYLKIFRFISVLFCLCIVSGQLYCQDLLYKKDNTVASVNIKDFNGKTVIYQLPGDSSGRMCYISKSVLDSLKYQNGKSLNFSYQDKDLGPGIVKRNFIGVDIFNLIKGKKNIWYERMSENGRRSYFAELFINSNPSEADFYGENSFWSNFNFNKQYFFTRVGVNFYPFNYSLPRAGDFRFYDGLSVFAGSYRKIKNGTYPPESEHVFAARLMWNLNARFYLASHVQFQGGVDISLLPFLAFVCPELGFSIGF